MLTDEQAQNMMTSIRELPLLVDKLRQQNETLAKRNAILEKEALEMKHDEKSNARKQLLDECLKQTYVALETIYKRKEVADNNNNNNDADDDGGDNLPWVEYNAGHHTCGLCGIRVSERALATHRCLAPAITRTHGSKKRARFSLFCRTCERVLPLTEGSSHQCGSSITTKDISTSESSSSEDEEDTSESDESSSSGSGSSESDESSSSEETSEEEVDSSSLSTSNTNIPRPIKKPVVHRLPHAIDGWTWTERNKHGESMYKCNGCAHKSRGCYTKNHKCSSLTRIVFDANSLSHRRVLVEGDNTLPKGKRGPTSFIGWSPAEKDKRGKSVFSCDGCAYKTHGYLTKKHKCPVIPRQQQLNHALDDNDLFAHPIASPVVVDTPLPAHEEPVIFDVMPDRVDRSKLTLTDSFL